MDDYVIVGTTGHGGDDEKTELHRLYYSIVDSVLGEMDHRFSERSSTQLACPLVVLNQDSDTFLDLKAVRHIMNLSQSPIIETE